MKTFWINFIFTINIAIIIFVSILKTDQSNIRHIIIILDFFLCFIFIINYFIARKFYSEEIVIKNRIIYFLSIFPFSLILFIFPLSHFLFLIFIFKSIAAFFFIYDFFFKNDFFQFQWGWKIFVIIQIYFTIIHFIALGWIRVNYFGEHFYDYIDAIYWAVTTITTVGFGDLTPKSKLEKLYTIPIMLLGVLFYGLIIRSFTNLLSIHQKYKRKYRDKMIDVNRLLKYYNVPSNIKEMAISYYRYNYHQNLTENDEELVSDLPINIRKKVILNIKIKIINSIEVFKNSSYEFKKEIANLLEKKEFTLDEKITSIDEEGNEIYFINKGIVKIENRDKKVIAHLHEGNFFGERSLLKNEKRNASVIAESFCSMYVLQKKDFLNLLEKHPNFKKNIKSEIEKRL